MDEDNIPSGVNPQGIDSIAEQVIEEKEERIVARLVIDMNAKGLVKVMGPIGNKLLCYGLLEAARDSIAAFKGEPEPKIRIPKLEIVSR